MRFFPLLLSAAALLGLGAGSAKAGVYYPECLGLNDALVETMGNTVICQDMNDPDDWSWYEFTERADGLYDLSLSVGVNGYATEYAVFDVVTVLQAGIPSTAFFIEADGTVTPGRDSNMMLAALHQDTINALIDTRAYYGGY